MNNLKYGPVFVFVCHHILIIWPSGASESRNDPLAPLDAEDDILPDDEAIEMDFPDGFRLEESRPGALDNSLAKRGVLVRLSLGWFGGLITCKSHERTKELYDYRVHREEDQSMWSMKLQLGAYSTETNAAVRAWVLPERNDKHQTWGAVGGGGPNSQLGNSEAGGEKTAVSGRGGALAPNVRIVDHAD